MCRFPVYFKRTRKGGKVGLRVTRRNVPSYEIDEAEIEKRSGKGLQARVSPESVLGRETRNGKGKWGLRITSDGRVGSRVPREGKFGTRTMKNDSDHNDEVPEVGIRKMANFCQSIFAKVFYCV